MATERLCVAHFFPLLSIHLDTTGEIFLFYAFIVCCYCYIFWHRIHIRIHIRIALTRLLTVPTGRIQQQKNEDRTHAFYVCC